jgi:hypothetical protein
MMRVMRCVLEPCKARMHTVDRMRSLLGTPIGKLDRLLLFLG